MAASQSAVVAPLANDKMLNLSEAVSEFDCEQLLWSSGYLAGLARAADSAVSPSLPSLAAVADAWHIFYATETGNSRQVAEAFARRANDAGLTTEIHDLVSYKARHLAKVGKALFIVATHGIGEAAEGTEPFFEYWLNEGAPRLNDLEYSVLALGDSSYADFCETGRQFDDALTRLGARRIAERVECDVDFEDSAEQWSVEVLGKAESGSVTPNRAKLRAVSAPQVSRNFPFNAEVLTSQKITGHNSTKDVRHIELDLASSGLTYLPGDSLGVIAENPPQLVEAFFEATGFDRNIRIDISDTEVTLDEALSRRREITALSRPFLDQVASRHARLQIICDDRDEYRQFLESRQVIDVINDYPVDWEPQLLIDSLRKLPPRLYSIASSPDANPEEAHLAVSVVNYNAFGRDHWGAASNYLAGAKTSVPIYVEPNEHFRLPASGDTPIIMIGAGTGIAPYRAFVEHRQVHGHSGDNWLIFGDRNFSSDFLYQLEWLRYRKEGYLKQLDVAFSRDETEKVYVQHRVRAQARRVYEWLERGAHIYVCGDASRMAGDVHETLLQVLEEEGRMTNEKALEYLDGIRANGRYQRDVY